MIYVETIVRVPEGFMLVQQNVRPTGQLVTLDTVVMRSHDIHRGPTYTAVRVVGEETIDVGGTHVKTWKIETEHAGRRVQHWIDRQTRRELRVVVKIGETEMIMERAP